MKSGFLGLFKKKKRREDQHAVAKGAIFKTSPPKLYMKSGFAKIVIYEKTAHTGPKSRYGGYTAHTNPLKFGAYLSEDS